MKMEVNGILLLYWHPITDFAPTMKEHIESFERYSSHKVWKVNTEYGFPPGLSGLRFKVIVLHYSLFGGLPFCISEEFLQYVSESGTSYKVAFFQDEYRYWPQRADVIARCRLDCIYSLVEPRFFAETYEKYANNIKLIYTIPGFVSEDMIEMARQFARPDGQRAVDIGYRARELPISMGKGAQEKYQIGVEFKRRAQGLPLVLDIETGESRRIYGRDYYLFLAGCKGMLGVESGVSIFDIDDTVRVEIAKRVASEPGLQLEDIYDEVLKPHEERIPYRTISPRHFEAAAFRICQILFEGEYSGILKPMEHYIPLKKDFSNFNEVMKLFLDENVRNAITEKAYDDLVSSGRYSYESFVSAFDHELSAAGLQSEQISEESIREVTLRLQRGQSFRKLKRQASFAAWTLYHRPFPGRKVLARLIKPLLKR